MNKEKKLNIDDIADDEFMEKTSLTDLIDLVEQHIKQQKNDWEEDFPDSLRDTLQFYANDPVRARQLIEFDIGTYAYWNGGACQDLD